MSRAAQHKDNLVQTAMRLFRRRGYASIGLQEILQESGAPKGSLYHYFPEGKVSLGAAAVDLAGHMINELLNDLANKHKKPEQFVKAYCQQMAEWMEESGYRSGCPLATTVLETVPDSIDITQVSSEAIDNWIETIASVYQRDGASTKESKEKAQLVIASVEGALILCRIRQSKLPLTSIARQLA